MQSMIVESKTKQPNLSRKEALQLFIEIETEKTEILMEAIRTGKIKTLKDSGDLSLIASFSGAYPAARAFDKLFIEK
jgi:hypothetical protein